MFHVKREPSSLSRFHEDSPESPPIGRARTILEVMVDDEKPLAQMIASHLDRAGFDAMAAASHGPGRGSVSSLALPLKP